MAATPTIMLVEQGWQGARGQALDAATGCTGPSTRPFAGLAARSRYPVGRAHRRSDLVAAIPPGALRRGVRDARHALLAGAMSLHRPVSAKLAHVRLNAVATDRDAGMAVNHRDSKGWRAQNRRTGSSVERYDSRGHLGAEPDLGIARNFGFVVKCFEECWVCCLPTWRSISARQTPSST